VTRHYVPDEVIRLLAQDAQDPMFVGGYLPLLGNEATSFAVRCREGLSVVLGSNSLDAQVKPWFLTFAAGIALDTPDIDGALHWSNSRNRELTIGRYICCIDEDRRMAAVIYTESVNSTIIGPEEVWIYLTRLMTIMAKTSASEPPGFIRMHGGIPFSYERHAFPLAMMALSPA
jgi:hypothetical protein